MIRLGIKVPIGREFDGQEYTIKCMDPGVTFAVELHTLEAISPWREMAVPYQIPEGSTAKLRVTRPDRAYTVTKATIEGGTILCPVHPYSVATPGKCAADVAVYGPDGKRLTGATFHFFVDRECAPANGENAPVFVDSIQGLIEFVGLSAERAEAAAERAENAGTGGDDGGHYIPVVTQPAVETIQFAFTPSKESMPAVTPVTVTLPSGGQDSAQNPAGTKVYVTLADDGTIVIAPDVGDHLADGVTITATLTEDGTILIGGGQNA